MEQSYNYEKWINELWRNYSHFVVKKVTILVMDDASMHKIHIVKNKIKECKTKISMIPGGLTRYLQPLDVSINKPFKDKLKKRYTKYYMNQQDIKARVTQENMINWIAEVWYDDKLSSEIIIKPFKTARITRALNGSEKKSSLVIIIAKWRSSNGWTSRATSRRTIKKWKMQKLMIIIIAIT